MIQLGKWYKFTISWFGEQTSFRAVERDGNVFLFDGFAILNQDVFANRTISSVLNGLADIAALHDADIVNGLGLEDEELAKQLLVRFKVLAQEEIPVPNILTWPYICLKHIVLLKKRRIQYSSVRFKQ